MNIDCGFKDSECFFRYRAGGIIVKEDKMLFVESYAGNHFYMIGGGVRIGETSMACLEREKLEETGIKAKPDRVALVCENIFVGEGGSIDGLKCHTIEFYYVVSFADADNNRDITDDGEKLVWIPIKDLTNYNIKPNFFRERIEEILTSEEIIHIINIDNWL